MDEVLDLHFKKKSSVQILKKKLSSSENMCSFMQFDKIKQHFTDPLSCT